MINQKCRMSLCLKVIVVIGLLPIVLLPQSGKKTMFKLEDVKTDIENPIAIISVEKPANDISPIHYIVRTEHELLFCDGKFNVINRRKTSIGTSIICSKKSRYLLLKNIKSEYENKIALIDNNGKLYWSKTVSSDFAHYPTDYNGNVFQFEYEKSIFTTISKDGEILNKTELFENPEICPTRRNYLDISESGKYCVLLTEIRESQERVALGSARGRRRLSQSPMPKRKPSPQAKRMRPPIEDTVRYTKRKDGEPTLFLFDYNGVLLRKLRAEEEQPAKVFINDDGSLIFYAVKDIDTQNGEYTIALVNNNLEKIFSKSFSSYPRSVLFTQNSIIIGYLEKNTENEYKLSALDKNSGTEIWTRELKYAPVSLLNTDNQRFEVFVCTKATFQNPIKTYWMNTYDMSGNILSQIEIGNIENEGIRSVRYRKKYDNRYFTIQKRINVLKSK